MLAEAPPGWGAWNPDPAVIGAALLVAGAYAACYRRAHQRAGRRGIGAGHWLAFVAGLATIVLALLSPLDPIGERWLLSAHVIQHVLLADIAPALLILGCRSPLLPLGLPPSLVRLLAPGRRLGGGWLRSGWLAVAVWAAFQWVWSVPTLFDAAASHPLLHGVEHLTLLTSGIILWWAVIDPLPDQRHRTAWAPLAYLAASRTAAAIVCLPLTWLGTTLYPRYVAAPRTYGLSPLTDQQIAGAAMCVIELLVFGIAFMVVFLTLLGRESNAVASTERASSKDVIAQGAGRRTYDPNAPLALPPTNVSV